MSNLKTTRKLAAILFADVVGYTKLMQKDESAASIWLKRFQNDINESIDTYNGTIVNFYGDGVLCTFENPLEAIRFAIALQSGFQNDPLVPVRIGIHSGTVVTEGDKVYGDSVNVASRIESMGIPGAILVSKKVRDDLKNQPDLLMPSLGSFEFKNVEEPIEVFAFANEGFAVPKRDEIKGKVTQSIQSKRKRNWLIPVFFAIIIMIGGGYYFFSRAKTTDPKVIDAITIFPFDIKSGNSEIQYLSKGIVDLISTKLEGVPNLNPIDPNRIFNELNKVNEEVPVLETAISISNTLGAAEFILGSIIEINDVLQISASKYDSKGALMARETIEGEKTQLAVLMDNLTRKLIADKLEDEGQELNSIAMMTSESFPALKAYLEGEQAYRKTEFEVAFDYFETAVGLDSTFAMAWYRLNSSRRWGAGHALNVNPLDKAIQYSEKLPPKWQDLIKARKLFQTGLAKNENMIADMLRKYGEHPELTNLMAEHIFHFYPIHGRSFMEAKPWLEKSRELDPQNLETLRHLGDIAWTEGDEVVIRKIMDQLPAGSREWIKNRIRLLTYQDTVTEANIEEVVNHPRFSITYFAPIEAIPENPNPLLELGLRFEPYEDNERRKNRLRRLLALLSGDESEAVVRTKQIWKTNPPDDARSLAMSASIIASRSYLPYEDLYQMLLDSLAVYDDPQAFFASAKYAWALGQEAQYQANKNKLAAISKQSHGTMNPARYYHWTLAAFEARQKEDYDKALICIDSAFSYSPSARHARISEAALDKIFILADIYEAQQEYEKGILRLENLPMWRNFHESKGYATFRLTQLYEKNGDIDKALAKCNLFIRNYKDCDEKFRPWFDEVAERQERLIAQVN